MPRTKNCRKTEPKKPAGNHGRKVLLQATTNPILEGYEHAQDLACAAFEPCSMMPRPPAPQESMQVPPAYAMFASRSASAFSTAHSPAAATTKVEAVGRMFK